MKDSHELTNPESGIQQDKRVINNERRSSVVFFELNIIRHLIAQLRSRLQVLRAEPEAGYSTEAVVVIALLVAMAITAVGIIAAKVISTAHNISTGGSGG